MCSWSNATAVGLVDITTGGVSDVRLTTPQRSGTFEVMRGRPVALCPLQPCSTRSRTSREHHRARHPVHSDGGCTRSTSRCPRGAEVTSPQVGPDAADESGCRPSYVLRTVCDVPTRHPRGQGDCDRKCQPLLLRVGRAVRQASRGTAGDTGLRWAMARCERGRWLMTRSCNRSPPPPLGPSAPPQPAGSVWGGQTSWKGSTVKNDGTCPSADGCTRETPEVPDKSHHRHSLTGGPVIVHAMSARPKYLR